MPHSNSESVSKLRPTKQTSSSQKTVQPNPNNLKSKTKQTLTLVLTFLLGILIGFGGYYFAQNHQRFPEKTSIDESKPSTNSPTTETKISTNTPTPNKKKLAKWTFLTKEGAVAVFDQSLNQTKLITENKENVAHINITWYESPILIDKNNIAYSKCHRDGTSPADPYTCSLIKHHLATQEKTVLASQTSTSNSNTFQIGGRYINLAASHDGRYLAYVKSNYEDYQSAEAVYLFDIKNKTEKLVTKLPLGGGRSGVADEDNSLHFSNSNQYLLINSTKSLPAKPEQQNSTLLIAKIDQTVPEVVYRSPANKWFSYGRWLDQDKAIAKYYNLDEKTADLVLINAKTASVTTLKSNILEWRQIRPVTGTTDRVVYFKENEQVGTGITTYSFNFNAQEQEKISTNLIPIRAEDNKLMARTTQPCNNPEQNNPIIECGMYGLNGQAIGHNLGVLDLKSLEFNKFNIGPQILKTGLSDSSVIFY